MSGSIRLIFAFGGSSPGYTGAVGLIGIVGQNDYGFMHKGSSWTATHSNNQLTLTCTGKHFYTLQLES